MQAKAVELEFVCWCDKKLTEKQLNYTEDGTWWKN